MEGFRPLVPSSGERPENLVGKYDPETVFKKLSLFEDTDDSLFNKALNTIGLSREQITPEFLEGVDALHLMDISRLIGDIRLHNESDPDFVKETYRKISLLLRDG